jgi:hypothetical protein
MDLAEIGTVVGPLEPREKIIGWMSSPDGEYPGTRCHVISNFHISDGAHGETYVKALLALLVTEPWDAIGAHHF